MRRDWFEVQFRIQTTHCVVDRGLAAIRLQDACLADFETVAFPHALGFCEDVGFGVVAELDPKCFAFVVLDDQSVVLLRHSIDP